MKTLPKRIAPLLLAALPVRAAVELAYVFSPGADIPDFGQYVDSRVISSPGFTTISKVTVDLALGPASGQSMWLGDLYATLTHGTALESSRVAVLLNRPGRDRANPFGSDLGALSITLDDTAPTNVFTVADSTGTYRPDGRLAVDAFAAPVAFVPGDQTLNQLGGAWLASNRWSLLVADTTAGDTARLTGWTLRIRGELTPGAPVSVADATATFDIPPPGPVVIGAGGTARFLVDSAAAITLNAEAVAEFFGSVTGQLDTAAGGTVRLRPGAVFAPLNFTLGPGATLTGSGIVASPATIRGLLSPGQSPGILTFTAGLTLTPTSTTTFEIDGPFRDANYDGIDLTTSGQLFYDGTLSLVFSTPITSGTYDLFNRQEPVAQSGDFALVTITGDFVTATQIAYAPGLGWSARIDDHLLTFTNATGDLVVALIPEPALVSVAAGLMSISLLGFRRRR